MKRKVVLIMTVSALMLGACCKEKMENITPGNADVGSSIGKNGDIIEGKYIVIFKETSGLKSLINSNATYNERIEVVKSFSLNLLKEKHIVPSITQTYGKVIHGFAASLTSDEVLNLTHDSRISYIEPDRLVILGKPGSGGGTVSGPQETPWGIARVGSADGSGKFAWIIDTGIDFTHPDLNVDVVRSKTFILTGVDSKNAKDNNGHGTHVSGTIAAKNNTTGVVGVAYGAKVVAVKVLNSQGSGAYSGVIAGVDYVGATAAAGDVANLSLGGPISLALDVAVLNASNNGIFFAVAAGNESADANLSSPSRVNGPNVFTVSAMGLNDSWASFSNYGNPPIDFCEPGVNIKSTWKGGTYNTISGTSMATPHMAGILLITNGVPATSGNVVSDPDGNADLIGHL